MELGNESAVSPDIDVVYFLMFNGWSRELRSNRWHYARRWARHAQVVLIQPAQILASRRLASRAEPRIDNCRVLEIKSSSQPPSYLIDSLIQLGQVTADMERHGFKRPLLWLYNPNLVGLYAMLPAVGRVMHATENYFQLDGVSTWFLEQYAAAATISDIVFAVSEGVSASIRANVSGAKVAVITNGCDYSAYAGAAADERLLQDRGDYGKVAIYAGNINTRLDYVLLQRCVREGRRTLFVFVGPVSDLPSEDAARWRWLVREPNVQYFGRVDPDRLPGLYRAADVGIIPYKQVPLLVENGFPLKVLEMCATGLPVVATLMKPIARLTSGVVVTSDHDGFASAVASLSRDSLSPAERDAMRRVCQQHDYDNKFRQAVRAVTDEIQPPRAPATRIDLIVPTMLWPHLRRVGAEAWRGSWMTLRRGQVWALMVRVWEKMPSRFRQKIPQDVRRRIRTLVRGW